LDSPALLGVRVPPGCGEPPLLFSVQKNTQGAHVSSTSPQQHTLHSL